MRLFFRAAAAWLLPLWLWAGGCLAAPADGGYDFVVAQDGSGDFRSVQEAVNAVPDFRKGGKTRILVRRGVYKEKLVVAASKRGIVMTGEEGATVSYGDYASRTNRFGESIGTSGSASVFIFADDFTAVGMTFENTAGPVGQAVACLVAGDRAVFRHCRFLGFQDTLYTFGRESRQYYDNCYIEGTVDFVFGASTCVFSRCRLHSKGHGYVTAPSTLQNHAYGYVFLDCRLTADEGVDRVYLSRPWRDYARAVFVRCHLGGHIAPAGWHNWGNPAKERTVFYAECGSTGPGARPGSRAAFGHQLSVARDYDAATVLAGADGWNPAAQQ